MADDFANALYWFIVLIHELCHFDVSSVLKKNIAYVHPFVHCDIVI